MSTPATIEAIRKRAAKFAIDFAEAAYEMGQAQSFIRGLCEVFDLPHLRAVSFEHRVKKITGKRGRIDGFFPGLLLIEMKSAGEDLELAYDQATEYLPNLPAAELPRHILVSDFKNIHLYDRMNHSEPLCFKLADLPKHVDSLLFMAGYKTVLAEQQAAINTHAAETLANLHDVMKANGYTGKDLETYLVRLVFCLFGDDTALFGRNDLFHNYLVNYTRDDGSDLHQRLDALFEVLDIELSNRQHNVPTYLSDFPYVNGALFSGKLSTYYFDEASRKLLLDCVNLDWSDISPEIFGALFQSIMHFDDEQSVAKSKKRREFGAHYTSDTNIQKAIAPLFIDELRAEFNSLLSSAKGRGREAKLREFHVKLSSINIMDPACGCGNFLVVAYRELRMIELEVITTIYGRDTLHLDIDTIVLCNVSQCYGIEIDPAAAQIATVALWLTDHQINMKLGQRLGTHYARLPLVRKANIACANALQIDWNAVLVAQDCSVVVGNPPFVGAMLMNDSQRDDMALVFQDLPGYGVLDYVSAWYWKVAKYIKINPKVYVAFVSTNSITQGEQVGLLWAPLMTRFGIKIGFAHQTFRWSNEGRGVAAVHCIIIGFGITDRSAKMIYEYEEVNSLPEKRIAKNINAYLVDAPDVFITNRSAPISNVPAMAFGNMPRDGGQLLLTDTEKDELIAEEPDAAIFIRPFISAKEFLNNGKRWCLWLKDATPTQLRQLPKVLSRVENVRVFRSASKAVSTRKFALTPSLFCQISQPTTSYLLVPRHSSENRRYIPLGFFSPNEIVADSCLFVGDATLYHFGIMTSLMHVAWVKYTCGRIKSDYRYSKDIVYNNYPWPNSTDLQKTSITTCAQAVIDARALFSGASLADLYDPLTMPPALIAAHQKLDLAVDKAYEESGGKRAYKSDADRVAFLFLLYQRITSLLPSDSLKGGRKSKTLESLVIAD